MRFLLLPAGSYGDVHPFVGVGLRLKERGHDVSAVTNGHFAGLFAHAGIPMTECGTADEYRRLTENADLWHPTRGFQAVMGGDVIGDIVRRQYAEVVRQAGDGRTVLVAGSLAIGARLAQETHGLPMASAHLQPTVFRCDRVPPAYGPNELPRPWWPRWLTRTMYRVLDAVFVDPVLARWLDPIRRELGLPRVRRFMDRWLHAPGLVLGLFPEWFAPGMHFPPQARLTGFPLYDERDAKGLAAEVRDYLAAGTPPVVFTPGSAMRFGQAFFAAAADACARVGRRGLFLTRYPEQLPSPLPAGVAHFDFVPLSLLLPHAAAIVHHGGIGTTSQALAAGVPQLVMPLSHDQFDNAARLRRLGVGRSLPSARFAGPRVAAELSALLGDPAVAAACREVAGRFEGADGPGTACDALEAYARSSIGAGSGGA